MRSTAFESVVPRAMTAALAFAAEFLAWRSGAGASGSTKVGSLVGSVVGALGEGYLGLAGLLAFATFVACLVVGRLGWPTFHGRPRLAPKGLALHAAAFAATLALAHVEHRSAARSLASIVAFVAWPLTLPWAIFGAPWIRRNGARGAALFAAAAAASVAVSFTLHALETFVAGPAWNELATPTAHAVHWLARFAFPHAQLVNADRPVDLAALAPTIQLEGQQIEIGRACSPAAGVALYCFAFAVLTCATRRPSSPRRAVAFGLLGLVLCPVVNVLRIDVILATMQTAPSKVVLFVHLWAGVVLFGVTALVTSAAARRPVARRT